MVKGKSYLIICWQSIEEGGKNFNISINDYSLLNYILRDLSYYNFLFSKSVGKSYSKKIYLRFVV